MSPDFRLLTMPAWPTLYGRLAHIAATNLRQADGPRRLGIVLTSRANKRHCHSCREPLVVRVPAAVDTFPISRSVNHSTLVSIAACILHGDFSAASVNQVLTWCRSHLVTCHRRKPMPRRIAMHGGSFTSFYPRSLMVMNNQTSMDTIKLDDETRPYDIRRIIGRH